ncbi:hypothetical protein [Massilia yuzhufengensis]|nr:hypothetical protein [Massilia yuzhufengensis]
MMTSTPVTQQQQTDGRTVREVVEFNHELVGEVWCRRIFRQLLQSLEMQYAMQMPHRPITPETVLVLDSGDPMLLPTTSIGDAWSEAGDMHDLAAVVHYAITREFPPAAPLQGRASVPANEYSDSFVTAVDRCLAADPQQRPKNIEQLRNLLGIVPLGSAVPLQAVPASPPPAATILDDPAPPPEKGRRQRWLLLVAAATVLLGALGALFALLHQADSRDTVALALPVDEPEAVPTPPATVEPAPAPPAAPDAGPPQLAAPAATAPDKLRAAPIRQLPAGAGASYKLLIKPWGMIQVNGVDQGVSPPLKRLTLPPGQHSIRIVNPSFPEHTVLVNATKGGSAVIELDFSEETP